MFDTIGEAVTAFSILKSAQ